MKLRFNALNEKFHIIRFKHDFNPFPGELVQFPRVNLKKVVLTFEFQIILFLIFFIIVLGLARHDLSDYVGFIGFLTIPIVLILFLFNKKITISTEGITSEGWFRTRFISWPEVRQYGVFESTRNGRYQIEREDWYKPGFLSLKHIFVSKSDKTPVNAFWRGRKDFIFFHFREEALQEIEKYIPPNGK